jgi:hypothetical protein
MRSTWELKQAKKTLFENYHSRNFLLWWQIKFPQCLLMHSAPGHNAGGLFCFAMEQEHRWQCRSKLQHQLQRLNHCYCLHITTLLTHPISPNSSSSGIQCINVNQPWTFTKWRILPPKPRIIYERLHSSFKTMVMNVFSKVTFAPDTQFILISLRSLVKYKTSELLPALPRNTIWTRYEVTYVT